MGDGPALLREDRMRMSDGTALHARTAAMSEDGAA